MMEEEMAQKQEVILKKAIIQAYASIKMDDLPLSKEYVLNYTARRIKELKEEPKLVLKRGDKSEQG